MKLGQKAELRIKIVKRTCSKFYGCIYKRGEWFSKQGVKRREGEFLTIMYYVCMYGKRRAEEL